LPAGRPGGGIAALPGLGNRPDIGARPSQLPNRTPEQRRDQLQDRLSNRDQIADREHIREDWQQRYDNIYERHQDWHHGCWPGHGGDWWHHMWSEHTALMAWGTTMWGINRLAYGFGYWGYDNPYYSEDYSYPVDYSQPLPEEVAVEQPAGEIPPAMSDFDTARAAFYQGDYAAALGSTDKALAALPSDPIIHEFRALVLFAQSKYPESAAGLYSVLSVGPGWDWTTLISLYPNVDVYTKQLRTLESRVKQNPNAADARFVLAYHYLTQGNKDAAATQYKQLYEKSPQDTVIKELLLMTGGPEAIGAPTTPAAPAATGVKINATELVGRWSAAGEGGAKFVLDLTQEGRFNWTYSQDGKSQAVKGVYALDGDVLAMEPETGGTLLAQLTQPRGGSFNFALLGAPPGDPGLKFAKAQ
jgi:tetratricopeptide (TPR) repeat protein